MKKIFTAILLLMLSGCKITSQGEKVGIIVKCATEGFFISTYECELIRGGMSSASGTIGQSFHFTVENKSLIPLFEKALNEQKEVHLGYHKEFVTILRTETVDNSFADNIDFMK
jgi:hypothetical protein